MTYFLKLILHPFPLPRQSFLWHLSSGGSAPSQNPASVFPAHASAYYMSMESFCKQINFSLSRNCRTLSLCPSPKDVKANLRGFQGTVYRSARWIYTYKRSKRGWKKWETGKANCCGDKSCLLFFYKWIKLRECCHPYRQTLCSFPYTLVWTILQKTLSKGHLPPFLIWICWKVIPCFFSVPLRQALTAYLGMLLPTSFGEFPSCCTNLPLQILREPCFRLAWVQFFTGDLDGCGAKRHPGVLSIPGPFASRWQSVSSSKASLGTPEWSSGFSRLPSKLLAEFVWARFLLQNTVGFCWVFGNMGFFCLFVCFFPPVSPCM